MSSEISKIDIFISAEDALKDDQCNKNMSNDLYKLKKHQEHEIKIRN